MIENINQVALAGGVASIDAGGFLAIAANATQFAEGTLKLAGYLKKKLAPSLGDQIEEISSDVALIYSKFSRRCFLWGLWSLILSGYIAIDMPLENDVELLADFSLAALPTGGLILTLIRRRLHGFMNKSLIISGKELKVLMAYENLIDLYIKNTLETRKFKDLLDAHYHDEMEQLVGVPRPIAGFRDAKRYIGDSCNPKLTKIVSELSRRRIQEYAEKANDLHSSEESIFRAIAHNNLAINEWWQRKLPEAKQQIMHAIEASKSAPAVEKIIRLNRDIIEKDLELSATFEPHCSGKSQQTAADGQAAAP